MTNIICISNNARPQLLAQTLRTLADNTPTEDYTITVVFDNPTIAGLIPRASGALLTHPCGIVGELKNFGAQESEKRFGRGEWLMFIDDDIAFFPRWLEHMKLALTGDNQYRILGGVRHPYHQPKGTLVHAFTFYGEFNQASYDSFKESHRDVEKTDAVAGYCHFMRWSTWDKFGPYDSHAKGTGQSEDYAICRKVVEAGGAVGYVHPPCMAHTGITNSEGKPIAGGELIERVPGVLYL